MWRDEVDAHGAAMHHLGISVPSLQASITSLQEKGGRLIVGPGPGYAFVDMRPAYGLTIELNGR